MYDCFECDRLCSMPRTFPSLDDLETHLCNDHFKIFVYECERCPYAKFPTECTLVDHYAETHDLTENIEIKYILNESVREIRRKVQGCLIQSAINTQQNRPLVNRFRRTNSLLSPSTTDGATLTANVAENGLQVKQGNYEDFNETATMPNNSSDGNVLEQLSEHDAIESANQLRLRSSSNNSAVNLIQRKRTLPMNDHNSRTKLSVIRLNPIETSDTEMLFKCEHCSYASARKDSLIRHTRTHTGEKPFKCGHCTFACAVNSTLNIHVRTHTGEKPFKCDKCPYASATSGPLKKHMYTHTGEKPYKCSTCSYAGASSSDLYQHMRTHTGEKPFKCRHCSYACATSSVLNVHIRTHTGEKPYKCSKCAYAGAASSNLSRHMRTHIGEK